MAIMLFGQRIHSALAHGAGRLSFGLFKRLRNANLPLLVAFAGALIMFTRALSGAGFEGVDASASLRPQSDLNNSSSFWNTYGPIGESRWARLRSGVADTLWRCPVLSEEMTNSTQSGSAYTPGCLKAKLKSVVHARTVLLGNKVIAKDSSNFEVPDLPSLLSGSFPQPQAPPKLDGPPPVSNAVQSGVHASVASPNGNTRTLEENTEQAVEEERPRVDRPSKHGDGSGSRRGFEVRRKPH